MEVEISGCIKNTHGARGIRVFHPGLDFAKCGLGGFEIWVPQKYARRSRNTRFLSAPRCNLDNLKLLSKKANVLLEAPVQATSDNLKLLSKKANVLLEAPVQVT